MQTVTVLDGRRTRITLDVEAKVAPEAIRTTLRQVSRDQIAEQAAIRKDKPTITVDRRPGGDIASAQRVVVIRFPAAAIRAALGVLSRSITQAIGSTTQRETGALIGAWSITLFRRTDNGGLQSISLGAGSDVEMGPDDFAILTPSGPGAVYAAFVNSWVKHGGKLTTRGRRGRPGRGLGFMAFAARAVRRVPGMKDFSVRVVFSRPGPPGSSRVQGAPTIVIRPKRVR